MLKRILGRRTRMELEAWEAVLALIPRGRKTRGIQYDVLDYLFERLYEKVSEEEIRERLMEVRGHLQETGDPVKVAINLAIKELERLREPMFELVKIQESELGGRKVRRVQLNFLHSNAVIDFEQYRNFMEDTLAGEPGYWMVSVSNAVGNGGSDPFPGIDRELRRGVRGEALLNLQAWRPERAGDAIVCRYMPDSFANQSFLLLYERRESPIPFLGFVSNASLAHSLADSRYIIYQGEKKLTKLKYLDAIWRELRQRSLSSEEAAALREQARSLVAGTGAEGGLTEDGLAQALAWQACSRVAAAVN